MHRVIVVAAMVSALTAAGQDGGPPLVTSVTGTVRTADTGAPVAGATVQVKVRPFESPDPANCLHDGLIIRSGVTFVFEGVTDAKGRYAVEVPAGDADIWADAEGFIRGSVRDRVVLFAGKPVTADLRIPPAALLEGVVQDTDGKPIEGVYVVASSDTSTSDAYADTDANGRFRITSALPGETTFLLQHERFVRQEETRTVGMRESLQFTLERGVDVHGRVENVGGLPSPPTVKLLEAPGDHFGVREAEPSEDGTFVLRAVKPGRYFITADAITRETRPVRVEVPSTRPVVIAFERVFTLSGRLEDRRGKGIPNARVFAEPRQPRAISHEEDDEALSEEEQLLKAAAEREASRSYSAETDATGAFQFEDMAQGQYELGLHSYSHKLDGKPLATAGSSDVRMVARRLPQLTGRVLTADGEPVTDFWADGHRQRPADGRFSISAPERPGPMKLRIRAVSGLAPSVRTIQATGEDQEVGDIVLTPGRTVKGRLVDRNTGAPIGGARVQLNEGAPLNAFTMRKSQGTVRTDANGRFEIPFVEEGPRWIYVGFTDRQPIHGEYIGLRDDVEIQFRIGASVYGYLSSNHWMPGQRVIATKNNNGTVEEAEVAPDGHFILNGLGGGLWTLRVQQPDDSKPFEPHTIVAGGTTTQYVSLNRMR